MSILLQLLGLVFLIIIITLFLAFFLIRRFWKRLDGSLDGFSSPPSRIHLTEDLHPDWLNTENAASLVYTFKDLGFTPGTPYTPMEIPELKLCSFYLPEKKMFGVIYDHETVRMWTELMVLYEDGNDISLSNAQAGEEFDHRPESLKVFRVNYDLTALFREICARVEDKPAIEVTDDNFTAEYEKSYAREMDWHNGRGGLTMDEVRRIAEKSGMDVEELDLETTHQEIKHGELARWHKECLERFAKETDMPVSEWLNREDNYVIVSNLIQPQLFTEYLESFLCVTDEELEMFRIWAGGFEDSPALFEKINDYLPEDRKAVKVGDVSVPIPAKIYHIPYIEE